MALCCSQVFEPCAGRHASGHSWRIHLRAGVSSGDSGRSQRAAASLRLTTSTAQTDQCYKDDLRTIEVHCCHLESCCGGWGWLMFSDDVDVIFLNILLILYLNKSQQTQRLWSLFYRFISNGATQKHVILTHCGSETESWCKTSQIRASVKVYLKKKKRRFFLEFLTAVGWCNGHVESGASSHFCLFGAGSSEGSVDRKRLLKTLILILH